MGLRAPEARPVAASERPRPSDAVRPASARRGLDLTRQTASVAATASPVLAALLYTLASPPFDHALLAWAVPGLLLVPARRRRARQAFASGAAFGLGIGIGTTAWALQGTAAYFGSSRAGTIAFVLGVWMVFSALPYGLLALAYQVVARRVPAWSLPWYGAWLWVACEWLRSSALTGLPWALLAHSQWQWTTLLQTADLGGMWAVTFVVALVSVAAVEAVVVALAAREQRIHRALRVALAPLLALALSLAYGAYREETLQREDDAGGHEIAIVQTEAPRGSSWRRASATKALADYARATAEAQQGTRPAELVVWPESAVGFYPDRDAMVRAQLGAVARGARARLLFGASRLAPDDTARNSVFLVERDGGIGASYDKRRLVPFAEYDPLAGGRGATSADSPATAYVGGTSAAPLESGGLRLGPLVCYEVLFPSLARATVLAGANVLVNLSNDSWLDAGDGTARRQHMAMSVFRAVETRRPLLRAASGGISGVVDPVGHVVESLPSGAGVLRARILPRDDVTPYVRFGDAWIVAAGTFLAALALVPRGRP